MGDILGTFVGKTLRLGLIFRPEGGHALPGLVVESLWPGYLGRMLEKLPEGVVIITGTNGKTTTTKIVVQILKTNGKKVLTNSTGSNLTRGIVSSISRHATLGGELPYDMAVLEVDEATARRLVKSIRPRWVMGLNVSRDQLDRYGEIDTVASYVGAAMVAATEGVVANAGDPNLVRQARDLGVSVHYFGVAKDLKKYFPTDYELASVSSSSGNLKEPKKDVELSAFDGQTVTYGMGVKTFKAKLRISGQHNYLNGAAALALCRRLLPQADPSSLVEELSSVSLAFGRGERYRLKNGSEIELVLVKNPASFTQALASYGTTDSDLMMAINDNLADGRDVSWLWDVNFGPLKSRKVSITSGRRAADMALRLSYDGINTVEIESDVRAALKLLGREGGVILSTYTAMLELYGILSKTAEKLS